MANIVGTILSIRDFLENKDTPVSISYGGEQGPAFILKRNREYIIPDYQREIRWKKENLIELMADVGRGVKFLGNIILNKRSDYEYEVIDGQQRITVLLLIIYYISAKFGEAIDIIQTCKIKMANFDQFNLLVQKNFDISLLNDEETKVLINSDVFNQRQRYIELWQQFDRVDWLRSAASCEAFLTNIKRSQVNLIVNTDDTDHYSIDYFLDVNLKGVKLDTEDIFKGYLFSQDSRPAIRDEWKKFKIRAFRLNERTDYSTVKLLAHYLYCNLYLNAKFKNVQFSEDFLVDEVIILGERHYAGEHIIKTIRDNAYMLESMKKLNRFLEIIIDIIFSDAPTSQFKDLFNTTAEIDQNEKIIMHNFIKKIILDKNVIPKVLIMKYVIEVLFDSNGKNKADYRKIYGVYLLAVLFTVFEGDKNISRISGVVKDINWYSKVITQVKGYFTRDKISTTKITAQYKLTDHDNNENYQFRCKSLATIYNFFEIDNDVVKIRDGKINDLKIYVSDNDRFTHEHFIVNKSGKYVLSTEEGYNSHRYPSGIPKYANSIFNFIFIDNDLNGELDNHAFPRKIDIIDRKLREHPDTFKCEYSKMIIQKCHHSFEELISIPTAETDDNFNAINSYYTNDFPEAFSGYALSIIKAIAEKLGAN